jgi:hypothetical protein
LTGLVVVRNPKRPATNYVLARFKGYDLSEGSEAFESFGNPYVRGLRGLGGVLIPAGDPRSGCFYFGSEPAIRGLRPGTRLRAAVRLGGDPAKEEQRVTVRVRRDRARYYRVASRLLGCR